MMRKHVVLVVGGEHGADRTREVLLNLPENLARDIEKHVEGSRNSVYEVLLASALRHWREGSTQVGCLEIDARDSLWKYGYIYTVGRLTRKEAREALGVDVVHLTAEEVSTKGPSVFEIRNLWKEIKSLIP